ncbi:class I SAM-dependent methyltransferase [Bradyrhizobium sediminis]|uniref:Class I SAM-dependent methyltransferase n=1 Tax=Bradyrhizobium sediminis TaxID=2840469 RepID=A0A975RYB4_9BRAD|nr:class I SAM-dependent methyltransferase [Bradyrhizobium sediminis]QWG25107.1 class I SAM-dependent methyltransferase [Bradyrhizobium sediminis]
MTMSVQSRYQSYVSDQRQFFDELITEDWDSYKSELWDQTRRFEIAELFKLIQPRTIIDIGCGVGFHDQEMAKYPFVTLVDAIDPSVASIEKAEQHFPHPKVTRWVGGFDELSSNKKYDLAISFQVFEHLNEPERYLLKMTEIVSPEGYVAIVMPNRTRLSNALRRLRGLEPELLDVMHFREYSVSQTYDIGKKCGLTPFASFGYGLHGHKHIDRLSWSTRLKLGRLLPSLAHGICVILKN